MKSILPWVVALIGIAGAVFFYKSGAAKSLTIAHLESQVAETETLRAENEALKKTQLPADELARLTAAKEELPRLRNTIRQLTSDKSQLSQQAQSAQQAAQQAQSHAQAAQAQAEALAQSAVVAATKQPLMPDPVASANGCINNLRQIDAAKQQWALENNRTEESTPTDAELKVYISGNAIPTCLAKGKYTLGRVGDYPACSVAGHALTQ